MDLIGINNSSSFINLVYHKCLLFTRVDDLNAKGLEERNSYITKLSTSNSKKIYVPQLITVLYASLLICQLCGKYLIYKGAIIGTTLILSHLIRVEYLNN